jgi:translocation and assembly module TamB
VTARASRIAYRSALGLLAILASAGVAISAAVLLAWSPPGRPILASLVVRALDGAVAGKISLDGIAVLPSGGVDLRGVRVTAPDGREVLRAAHARVWADVTRLRARSLGLAVEIDGAEVDLSRGADGTLALARAFGPPARPGRVPPAGEGDGAAGTGEGWTLAFSRVVLHGASVHAEREGGGEALAAGAIEADARGEIGPGRSAADLTLRGRLDAPFQGPVEIALAGSRDGDAVAVPLLSVRLAENVLEAVGEGDLARRSGRVAVTRLGIDRADALALVPGARVGGDLRGSGFARSDGRLATAAVRVEAAGGGTGGEADLAVAMDVPPRAYGFDLRARALDPSRLFTLAPPGRVSLQAHGAVAGRSVPDLRGRIALALEPSTLRGAAIGPAELVGSAGGGSVEVSRLRAAIQGARVSGSGRWRARGPVSGELALDAEDLRRAAAAVQAIAGSGMPPLSGSGTARLTLSGTSDEPVLGGTVSSSRIALGDLAAEGIRLEVTTSGPPRTVTGRVEGTLRSLTVGDLQGRAVHLRGEVGQGGAAVALSVAVPQLGTDPVSLAGEGRFGAGRESILLTALTLAYPGTRYQLGGPAEVRLAGPSVDRLELVSGAQRIAVEGGRTPGGGHDLHVVATRIDLATLPRGVVPERLGLGGEATIDGRVAGTRGRTTAEAKVSLSRGAAGGLTGLEVDGALRLEGGRASGRIAIRRERGGSAEATAELPVPVRAEGRAAAVAARIRADGVDLAEVLRVAGAQSAFSGVASGEVELGGTVGDPVLRATVRVAQGAIGGLDRLALDASLGVEGGHATARIAAAREDRPLVSLEARVPVDGERLLVAPGAGGRALLRAPLDASVTIPGADLAAVGGLWGLPRDLAGRLAAEAKVEGTLAAPRWRGGLSVERGAIAGYSAIDLRLQTSGSGDRTALSGNATLAGTELLRADASVRVPPERLADADARRAAPVAVELTIPGAPLAGTAGADVPLSGTVTGRGTVGGTLGDPVGELSLRGEAVALAGRPVGAFEAAARYQGRRATATLDLRPASGGTLRATGSVGWDVTAPGGARGLRDAPATLRVKADRLDLAVAAALAPGEIRSASGTIAVDLEAAGPLGALRPHGSVLLEDGRALLVRYGEWAGGVLDVQIGEDAVEVRRLELRRGSGRLTAQGAIRGLTGKEARLEGKALARDFTFERDGIAIATIDGDLATTGTLAGRKLDARIDLSRVIVRLPQAIPRPLQPLDPREDIVVSRGPKKPEPRAAAPAPGRKEPAAASLEAVIRVVAGNRILVRSQKPKADVDLEGDVTFELSGGEIFAEGEVRTVRGEVEPIEGRNFVIQHGRVQFAGGPPAAAVLDVKAVYNNPTAVVTVLVTGPLKKPEISLSSQPPMDEAAIAMLIATGRADFKAGSAAVGTLNATEAGRAAAGALASQFVNGIVAGKLPLQSVAIDATTLRAGMYLGENAYLAYVRNFDAKPEEGENPDEVRFEYRITPRWKFELSAGTAKSGAASVIWSKDY